MMTADKQHDFDSIKLRNADCKEVLKLTKDRSVALIIVDPPYGGHTHNQNDWDVAWSDEEWIEIVREVYRVLVPGGHMIVFSSGKSTLERFKLQAPALSQSLSLSLSLGLTRTRSQSLSLTRTRTLSLSLSLTLALTRRRAAGPSCSSSPTR